MDATTHPHGTPETHHHDEHGDEHHELGFWRKYVFSTDHKVIGIQYGISGLIFLFFGFCLMMMMRWQLAYPGQALPVIGNALNHFFGTGSMPDGKMTPEFYNSLGAMHGTIMIFLGHRSTRFRRLRKFCCPAANRCARHDVSESERGQLLGVLCRWRHHAGELFRSGRRCQGRLDFLYAARRHRRYTGRILIHFLMARRSGWSDLFS